MTLQRPRPGRQIRETQHARRREQPGRVRRAAVTCTSRRLRRDLARLRPAPCIYIYRERDIYVNILFLIYAAPSTPTQPPQDPVARAPAMPKRRYFQRGAPKRWFSSAGVPTRRCFRRWCVKTRVFPAWRAQTQVFPAWCAQTRVFPTRVCQNAGISSEVCQTAGIPRAGVPKRGYVQRWCVKTRVFPAWCQNAGISSAGVSKRWYFQRWCVQTLVFPAWCAKTRVFPALVFPNTRLPARKASARLKWKSFGSLYGGTNNPGTRQGAGSERNRTRAIWTEIRTAPSF